MALSLQRLLPSLMIVQNPQEEVRMHNDENQATRQRKFRFEDDELWPMLPEAVRESCRGLWMELLTNVLNKGQGRLNERED
jgi:hypothetical protein